MTYNILNKIICFFSIISIAYSYTRLSIGKLNRRKSDLTMLIDPSIHMGIQTISDSVNAIQHNLPHWTQLAVQGISDASTAIPATPSSVAVCPDFGQPGWAPFCFLNGNPVFQAFDQFQYFVQSAVVSLHDLLKKIGIENAYGPSIIIFTVFVRTLLLPVTYQQLASTERKKALTPKINEIKEKYSDKNLQNQLIALLYQETKVNPLAGCLPAILQIPVFLALYRSFLNLANSDELRESFLWLPNLAGPVYGSRSMDWLTKNWNDFTPMYGWQDTLAFLSLPILLVIAQTISLKILTPPSDDPTIQRTQSILKYLPWMLGYFSLSVPAGLGLYWVVNNLLSTGTTIAIKEYFKKNPIELAYVDLDSMVNSEFAKIIDPVWGYKSEAEVLAEARANVIPKRLQLIPDDFE